MRNFLSFFFFFILHSLSAQNLINIAIISDQAPDNNFEIRYEESLREEIMILLQHRFDVGFKSYYTTQYNEDIERTFMAAYAENDVLIALGTMSSNYAIGLGQYPKPTIAAIVLDAQLQGLKKTDQGASGISNFTYIESPFDIKRDLDLLYDVYPFEHLEVLTEKGTIGEAIFIKQLFANYLVDKDIDVDHIFYSSDINKHLEEMEDKRVAVYALPYLGSDTAQIQTVFEIVNNNKIPSAALFGEDYLNEGALIGYEIRDNLRKIPRRVALTVMKIAEGQAAANLSVKIQSFSNNALINMETAREIGVYPSFETMSKATLINLDNINTSNELSLQKAIAEGLQSNLEIRVEQADVSIAGTEVDIAKSDLFPQVDVSTSLAMTDELTTLTRQGAQGRANWILSGQLSQLVFAEPVLANIAIQKMLQESEQQQLLQTQLDVVVDVTNAYMNILFAKNNLNIQQQNVARNKENYDISKAKEAIGYTGASDINRWEAELASANIELNNAFASLRQAKFQLNQLLNRPINEPFEVTETTITESMLLVTDDRVEFINNYGALDTFSNFLVVYALENLPELAQIDLGMKVQERLKLSRERAMYLPSLAINGSANRVLGRFDIPEGLPPMDKATTWEVGLGLSYPIFQGNNRRVLIEQSKLNVLQIRDTRKNAENQLELLVRANLENVGASYSRMGLAKTAAEASRKNFRIVQDAYSAGQVNVTTLIDAQNNALAAELNATNAVYTFIQDFLLLERSIGYFNFLATPTEKDVFFNKLQQHFNQK